MKSIRNFSKITIVLVAVFMVIALFRYREYDDTPLVPEQLEYYFDEGWLMYSSYSAEKVAVTLPYSGKIQASETIIFENTLSEEYADLTLKFSAENAAVRVLLDGEVLYPQEDTGDGQYYVYIPDITEDAAAERQLCIELTVLEHDREILLGGIVAEINSTFVVGLVGSNLTDIVCCLLIVITAMIMFVLAMIRWYTSQPGRGELYLGLFGLTAGVYSFIGTYTLNLFFDMREVYVIQEYLMLMLPLFLALYFEQNLRSLYPRRFAALLCVVSCNAVIQILLEWLGGWKLVQMADISTAVVGLACVTGIISLLQMKNKSSRYQIALSVLSVFVLLAGEVGKSF